MANVLQSSCKYEMLHMSVLVCNIFESSVSSFNCCVVSAADGQADKQVGLRDLSEPLIDHSEGQLFLSETFKIIVEEVLCKGTDVTQKVSSEA